MGRFLTDVAGYANTPALLGTVELDEEDTVSPLAIMHEFVDNQGDAWQFTSAYLDRSAGRRTACHGGTADRRKNVMLPSLIVFSKLGAG